MPILTTRPKIKRTYVQAYDRETGKSRSITVYNASPEDVVALIRRAGEKPRSPSPQRPKAEDRAAA